MPENSGKASKPKFTVEEKAQIYALFQQGLSHSQIAERMGNVNAQRISGVIRAGINFDKIPSGRKQYLPRPEGTEKFPDASTIPAPAVIAPVTPAFNPDSQVLEAAIQMGASTPTPPTPPTQDQQPAQMRGAAPALPPRPPAQVHQFQTPQRPQAAPQPQAPLAPGQDGFSGWSDAQSFSEGFNQTALAVRYVIYREDPADGLVGEETAPFDEITLSRKYGRGYYRIQRFRPGIPAPLTTNVRVSESFGDPKFPRRETASTVQQRPNYGRWGRPWARSQDSQDEEGRHLERPSLFDYSRHAPQHSDAAGEAIKAMGQMNLKALELQEANRRTGPDAFVAKFLSEQQETQRRQYDEQRRADDERRREDDVRHERRQKEADAEHRRRQEEEISRHQRELERIKAEGEARAREADIAAKRLIEIEAAKLKIVEEQNRAREESLKEELKRNREQMKERDADIKAQLKEMQEATGSQIAESRAQLEKELQREREQLDREQKLKEKALDKERELENKVLEIKANQIESQGTSEIVGVVNNLINKFSGNLNQILELKKLEAAATPETQAALIAEGKKQQASPEMGAHGATNTGAAAAQSAQRPSGAPQDQVKPGAQAPQNGQQHQEINMQDMIRKMVDEPFFKQVLEEWSLHVKTKQDGTTFLNMYREWMCDPNDHEGRKATTVFANFIAPREWEDFYPIIKDKLDKKVRDILDTEHAKTFYETFRSLLVEQIRAFWEDFGQQRAAVNAGRVAAGTEK